METSLPITGKEEVAMTMRDKVPKTSALCSESTRLVVLEHPDVPLFGESVQLIDTARYLDFQVRHPLCVFIG
jgi:hypothetical protein